MDKRYPKKNAPKKVFVLENNSYIEISSKEFFNRKKLNKEYEKKRFIFLHGMLMEVSENVYREFYKEERRQRYLEEAAEENHVLLYDSLTTDELNGEAAMMDPGMSVVDIVEQKMLKEELIRGIQQLDAEEQELLRLVYFEEMTERVIAAKYGVSQVAIHKKKAKVLGKLKKILEI